MSKVCPNCEEQFTPNRYKTQVYCTRNCKNVAWQRANPEKVSEYGRRYYEKDREKHKQRHVLTAYGLDWDTYQELTANGCMACGSTENLCIDHDHSCCPGKRTCGECIRGVLCGPCNTAEGFLGSDPERALALYEYMKEVSSGN